MSADTVTLIRADMLKLRRRRGLMAMALVASVGAVGVFVAVFTIRHAMNPSRNTSAGAVSHFENITDSLGFFLVVVAALIGVTAGAGDAELGVLRDLVATGRSRAALFASRAVAAAAITVAMLTASLLVATVPVVLAVSTVAPSFSEVVRRIAAVLAYGVAATLVCVGLATFVRSRGPMMAGVIAGTFVSLELMRVGFLGGLRTVFPEAAFFRLTGSTVSGVHFSPPLAIAVLVSWSVVALTAGLWWAQRIEV
jgi:ABC-type transport system involved in multi-copper enzyme maturation permease subunit